MFKKLMSTFLVTLLTMTALPAIALSSYAAETAEEGEGNGADAIAEAFGQYQVAQTVVESSGGIDVPVKLTTYVKDKTAHNSETIFYVINHLEERIGQESDVSILTDYINENYIIVVADYQKHPNAIASKIEYSIQALRNDISKGKYIGDLKFAATYKSEINFMVPAGYRLARDITYFNLLDHGCKGTAELIVKAWNSAAFKNGKGSSIPACEGNNYEGGWFEATDITQLVRPDKLNGNVAIPLDFDLGLDIVYPSNPTRETPVTVTASSWEQREGVNLGSKAGLFATALVFRGFTCAVYSHEYYPMARDDHYGYWSGDYGVARYNGVKTHTAAIRCIRYFSEQFGYSPDHIGVGGGSKASYCSLLGQENPELRAELSIYTGTYDDQYGNAAQPWQTYEKSGEKIPSNVQAVYTYMGDGTNLHASIVNETTAPTIIACGYYDQFGCWDKWPACQETYMKWDVPHLAITMNDLGHVCPYGQDPDLDYERTQSAADFYDYWLNDAAPKLVYTYPVNNSTTYKGEDPIQIQFTGEFELSEISSKIKIVDVTDGNKELSGTWSVCAGNTKFEFEGPSYVNGHTYSIIIPDTLTDRNGKTIAEGVTRTFVSAADICLTAVKDAYIVSGSSENKGTDTVIKLSGSTSRGYLEFDISSVKNSAVKTRLALEVTNDATNIIEIYALAEDAAAWQENTILWDNAPAYSTLIASVPVTGAGRYMADITDYVDGLSGSTVRLALVNKIASSGTVYDMKFDGLTSFPKATGQIENAPYSTSYGYRVGGAPSGVTGLSSAEDHTTGSGKSFCLVRNYSYDRFKLYNTLKTSDMTEADIGTTYRATLWAKSAVAISLSMGVMSPYGDSYGSNYCGTTSSTSLAAGEWTECELVYTITEKNFVKATDGTISEVACLLTIQGTGVSNIYVDDVKVEIVSTDVEISSREGTSAPTLYVDNNKGAVAIGKTQYTTFAEALAAVPTDGTATTITLQEDVTLKSGFSVPAGMNLTIDLNGYTMSGTDLANVSSFYAPIGVKGSLKIGNGDLVITGGVNYTFHVWNSGADNGAYLEFSDGLNLTSSTPSGVVQVGNQNTNHGTFVMQDGVTVKCISTFVYNYPGSSVTLYGGDVENTVGAIIFAFRGTETKVIHGGTYKSVPTEGSQLFRIAEGMVLRGGTFSEFSADKSGKWATVDDGFAMFENSDGTYSVKSIEAKIGTTVYESFYDALAAVPADGTETTIVLQRDVTLTKALSITTTQNVYLDLGDFTMTVKGTAQASSTYASVGVNGQLKIGNGTLVIDGAKQYGIHIHDNGATTPASLELTDGLHIKMINSVDTHGLFQVGNSSSAKKGVLTIQDGVTIESEYRLFYLYENSSLFIYGGDLSSTKVTQMFYFLGSAGTKEIHGGHFSTPAGADSYSMFRQVKSLVINGGTFSECPPDANLGEGCRVVDNKDGTFTVRKIKTVMIGNVGYETLNAAVAAVPTDGTLTVLEVTEDTEIASKVTIAKGQNILLDLGGYTVKLTDTSKDGPITVAGSLTVKNGTIKDELGTARRWTLRVYGDENTKLELLDGAIIDSNADYGTIQLGKDNTVTALDAHLIVHDGATITTGWLNIHANAGAKVTIYGGSFINPVRSYLLHFIGNDSITADRYIFGGTFTGNVTDSMYWAFAGAQNVTITGGTFNSQLITNEKISVPVADNHVVIENEDGTRTVKKLRYIGEPTDFTYVSQIDPDSNFGNQSKVILSGENGKNTMVLAEFDVSELANLNTLYIPICGTGDQKISVAVIDGWAFDASTVTYNNVQDKLWAELMTTEKAAKHVGRYTIGTKALEIDAEDILSLVTGDTFTLVLQADEKYVFDLNFNDRSELSISEGASQGIIGNTETLNVPYDSTYMAARGGYTSGCKIAFASAMDKDGKDSMMFRVTQGGQRYRFYNLFSTDTLTVLDIGRTFCISFDVMTTIKQSNSLNVGLHCRKSGDGITSPTSGGEDNEYKNYAANWRYKDQKVTTNANEWKTYTFEVTIDEFMVNHQIGMLCLNFGNIGSTEYFYIDNIKAEEIGGNETATATTFTAALPVAFVGEKEQISLGEGVTIIETSASMNTTDTDATYTDVIVHGRDSLVRVDNKTGALQIAVNGSFYSLCDAKGNVYTVGTESMPIAAILDKSAGTARYAANGKLAYYLDGTTVVNTYGTVAVFGGYTDALSVGAMSNPHGALTVSDTIYNTVASDVPTVVGTQMSTINNSVRVLSGIHSLYYSEIGFRAVRGDGTIKEWKTSLVYTAVNALGNTETAESLGCKYLSAFIVNGLEEATNGDTFTVTPLVYIGDQAIEGEAVTFTIAVEGGAITVSSNK